MKSTETIIKYAVILCLTALFALTAFILIRGWIFGYFDSINTLRIYIDSFDIWAPLILFFIQILLTILPICTSFTGCIVGAALFGAVNGFLTNYFGICIGSFLSFWLAKHFGIRIIHKMLSLKKYETYIAKINQSDNYPKLLFLAILLPMAPDNFLCYFSGLINMPTKKFITIILIAKPWCILFYSVFFAYFL